MTIVMKGLKYQGPFPIGWDDVTLHVAAYANGRIALLTWATDPEVGYPEPLFTATVNLPEQSCGPDEVWVKDWSENEGMTDWLLTNKIIAPGPTATITSDHVTVSRYKLTEEFQKLLFAVFCNEQQAKEYAAK